MKKIFLIPVILFSLSACVSYKLVDVKTKINDINKLAYFEPLAFIGSIYNDDILTINDSLSTLSKEILETVIIKNENNKVSKKLIINDIKTKNKVDKELAYLFQKILNYHKINNVKITPTIDSVLKTTKQRFVLATITDGFVKIENSNSQRNNSSLNKDLSTLDLLAPLPTKSISTLHALIIDAQKGSVIFYDHTHPVYKLPTDKKNIEKQYKKLFKGYYHN